MVSVGDQFWEKDFLEVVQTQNPIMDEVFGKVRSVAPTKATVFLTGETGTGKSLIAKLIHCHSSRRNQQFISVHCSAIPDTLLESELFGYEKGAFTGAIRRKLGKFEIAQGGTIFLDEIGTITPSTQVKLLQILQERKLHRLGGEEDIEVDVRIIAATNTNLKQMCEEGQFRKDLYYRLSVFPIEIPPLRERKEDIPRLIEIFLTRLNNAYGKAIQSLDAKTMEALMAYRWPGNIRELENLIERAYILETHNSISAQSLPLEFFNPNPAEPLPQSFLTLAEVRRRSLALIEHQYLKELLASHQGKINSSAKAAGVGVRQLHKLLSKYGIRKEEFKTMLHHRHR